MKSKIQILKELRRQLTISIKAFDLLEQVYMEIEVYTKVSDETMEKLRKFFDYDDSK